MAVWSTENSRAAVFGALRREEAYATAGSSIVVRFFDGWEFVEDGALSRVPTEIGIATGVPTGGELRSALPFGLCASEISEDTADHLQVHDERDDTHLTAAVAAKFRE